MFRDLFQNDKEPRNLLRGSWHFIMIPGNNVKASMSGAMNRQSFLFTSLVNQLLKDISWKMFFV